MKVDQMPRCAEYVFSFGCVHAMSAGVLGSYIAVCRRGAGEAYRVKNGGKL